MKHRTDWLTQQYRIRAEYAAQVMREYEYARALEAKRQRRRAEELYGAGRPPTSFPTYEDRRGTGHKH